MSKQSVLKLWMPALALVLLPLLKAVVVGAAPPAAPMMGFTVTPTPTTTTPTPPQCIPAITKRASPDIAAPGDEVTFTITVQNNGARATVNTHVVDILPEYYEILENGVTVTPPEWRREPPIGSPPEIDGQTVTVYLTPLSHGDQVTIVIRTRLVLPEDECPICVENVATLYTDNCGDPSAQTLPCWELPECGAPRRPYTWWMIPAGLITSVLGVSLLLVRKWRRA